MDNTQEFLQHLAEKGKKQDYKIVQEFFIKLIKINIERKRKL